MFSIIISNFAGNPFFQCVHLLFGVIHAWYHFFNLCFDVFKLTNILVILTKDSGSYRFDFSRRFMILT